MIASLSRALAPEPDLRRVRQALQDALVELETWRQSARTPEEWSALRRMAAALGVAQDEIAGAGDLVRSEDAAQLPLPPPFREGVTR